MPIRLEPMLAAVGPASCPVTPQQGMSGGTKSQIQMHSQGVRTQSRMMTSSSFGPQPPVQHVSRRLEFDPAARQSNPHSPGYSPPITTPAPRNQRTALGRQQSVPENETPDRPHHQFPIGARQHNVETRSSRKNNGQTLVADRRGNSPAASGPRSRQEEVLRQPATDPNNPVAANARSSLRTRHLERVASAEMLAAGSTTTPRTPPPKPAAERVQAVNSESVSRANSPPSTGTLPRTPVNLCGRTPSPDRTYMPPDQGLPMQQRLAAAGVPPWLY